VQDSSKDRDDYRQAIRYLLGELTGSDAEAFEQRYLADQDTFELLEAVEEDLIEDYLRDGLSPGDKSLFELRYASRSENRQKIEFAKELLRCAAPEQSQPAPSADLATPPPPVEAPKTTPISRQRLGPRSPSRPFAIAAAAALVLLAGVAIWLGISLTRLASRLAAEQQERARLERAEQDLRTQLETAQNNNQALSNELQKVQDQLRALEQRGSTGSIVSLLLWPSSVRGAGHPAEARLDPGVARLDLQLALNDLDFDLYRVTVRQLSGGVIWTANALKPNSAVKGKILKLSLPAANLKPGLHVVTLEGVSPSGQTSYAGEYSFTVTRP
jgi:hypothetical protein